MIWGFRTWGAMAARFRLHNSTAWPRRAVLPNFTTPLDAGQLVVLSERSLCTNPFVETPLEGVPVVPRASGLHGPSSCHII